MNSLRVTVIIIITICLILSGLYFLKQEPIESINNLNFTMELNPDELPGNISLTFIFKNEGDNSFNYSEPKMGKTISVFIVASNGSEYQWSGATDLGIDPYLKLNSNEDYQYSVHYPTTIQLSSPSGKNEGSPTLKGGVSLQMPVRHLDTEPLLNTCQSDKMKIHFDGLALYPQT